MDDPMFSQLRESRRQFLALVEEVRPELHRYCARMTGSVADGEDVVQDALARAYYELPELKELPALRAWLFRIAHNRALDFLRRYNRRMSEPLEVVMDRQDDRIPEPDADAGRRAAVRLAVSRFLELSVTQRSCVILMDVLDYSLDEIAATLELSVPAVKAALHRGRVRLRQLSTSAAPLEPRSVTPMMERYAALFNARDWEGIRAMLADDVRLDLVTREKRSGAPNVAHYFTNYGTVIGWRAEPAWLDGREVIAMFRAPSERSPGYFVELTFVEDRVATIRDFRYVAYIARDAEFELRHRPQL
jgi:RNA polymerase sigma factor (sigma-70 family)